LVERNWYVSESSVNIWHVCSMSRNTVQVILFVVIMD